MELEAGLERPSQGASPRNLRQARELLVVELRAKAMSTSNRRGTALLSYWTSTAMSPSSHCFVRPYAATVVAMHDARAAGRSSCGAGQFP
jgi:hypothetical protein